MKKSLVLVLFAVSSLVSLLAPGCAKDDAAPAEPNLGFKGESCEQRANCAADVPPATTRERVACRRRDARADGR